MTAGLLPGMRFFANHLLGLFISFALAGCAATLKTPAAPPLPPEVRSCVSDVPAIYLPGGNHANSWPNRPLKTETPEVRALATNTTERIYYQTKHLLYRDGTISETVVGMPYDRCLQTIDRGTVGQPMVGGRAPYERNINLAGLRFTWFTDSPADLPKWEHARVPAEVQYVFRDGRTLNIEYEPNGRIASKRWRKEKTTQIIDRGAE